MTEYRGRRVLVTGADGFIGSHLAEALAAEGAQVSALALYNAHDHYGWLDDIDPDLRARIACVRGDVRDAGFMTRLVAGQDVVFHLAALIAIPHSYDAPQSYVDVNVTGTLTLLEAARAAGVSRVVQTSTSEVYGTAQTEPIDESHPLQGQSRYSASKIGADMMADAFARSFDLPVVTLRPFNTYGPRQSERAVIASTVRQLLDPACETIRLGDLAPRRDFTYVSDSVEALRLAGSVDGLEFGAPYNAGTGIAVTIAELVETLFAITGSNKPVEQEDARLRPANSEVRALLADARRFSDATRWAARTSLEEGLARTVAWWRERLEAGRVRARADYVT